MGQTNGQSNGGKWSKSADGGRNANAPLISHGAGASSCNGATSDASVHRSEPNSARIGGASIDLDGRASVVGKPTNPAASVVSISHCSDPAGCVTLADILKCFNAAVSEEQAWALIYQSVCLYRNALTSAVAAAAATNNSNNNNTATDDLMDSGKQTMLPDTRLPSGPHNFNVHKDGSVHLSFNPRGKFDGILFFVCLFISYLSFLLCGLFEMRSSSVCVCVCGRKPFVRVIRPSIGPQHPKTSQKNKSKNKTNKKSLMHTRQTSGIGAGSRFWSRSNAHPMLGAQCPPPPPLLSCTYVLHHNTRRTISISLYPCDNVIIVLHSFYRFFLRTDSYGCILWAFDCIVPTAFYDYTESINVVFAAR